MQSASSTCISVAVAAGCRLAKRSCAHPSSDPSPLLLRRYAQLPQTVAGFIFDSAPAYMYPGKLEQSVDGPRVKRAADGCLSACR